MKKVIYKWTFSVYNNSVRQPPQIMNSDQIALLAHIRNLNAKTIEWVNSGKGRFACTLVEDLEHWAEVGVRTVEDYIKYELATEIYEGTKYAYGFKPNWSALMNCSVDELALEANSLRLACVEHSRLEAAEDAYRQEEDRHEDWLSAGIQDRFEDLAEAAGY
jgi:hypothetical protein